MKLIRQFFLLCLIIPFTAFATDVTYKGLSPSGQMIPIASPNEQMLLNPFPVYSNGSIVINHPAPGFKKINIPIDNSYQKNPGCYMMCYSHQSGLYKVGNDIYTQGMIRVAGTYKNVICQSTNADGSDINTLCNTKIKTCHGHCWAGGDTGGWYGMQASQ